uniref:Uncharacterized protein n=1 Tax=Arundo donax TaxID=35708 RepID=A0A0A9EYK3_ARUDO
MLLFLIEVCVANPPYRIRLGDHIHQHLQLKKIKSVLCYHQVVSSQGVLIPRAKVLPLQVVLVVPLLSLYCCCFSKSQI